MTPITPVTPTRLVAATTVVVVVPCVLYPLFGPWPLTSIPVALLLLAAFLPGDGDAGREGRAWRLPGVSLRPRGDGAGAETGASSREPTFPEVNRSLPVLRAPGGTRGTRVRPVALPSARDDYDLLFTAVVHWRWEGHVDLRLRNPVAPAVLAVVTRASELARDTDPGEHGIAEYQLAAGLAVETAVTGGGIVAWAEEVSLSLPEEDAERLRRLAGFRKDRELREVVREAEVEEEAAELVGSNGHRVPPGPAADTFGRPDPLGDPLDCAEEEHVPLDGPGSDVDGEGYESYWWPAETGGHESVEHDMQVAILRGLIDSVESGPARTEFAHEQLAVLERGGFSEVARRIRDEYPELGGDAAHTRTATTDRPRSGA